MRQAQTEPVLDAYWTWVEKLDLEPGSKLEDAVKYARNQKQALNAFLIGLVMGYVYYKTGSLILTMIIHFVNNGTSVILSNVESLKDYEYWIDILGKQNYTLVFIAACAVLAACIAVFSFGASISSAFH